MVIRQLDLLSSPPQMFIFQQKANKTLFGGILFIFYIIIMFIISFIYILNFALNDKYDIRYSLYKDFESHEEEYNKNEDLNPHLNFTIGIKKITKGFHQLDSNEFLFADNNFNILKNISLISSTPSNLNFFILHTFNSTEQINNDSNLAYVLNISYSGYKINHQDENIPLEKNNDKYIFYKELFFTLNKSSLYEINWNVIKYKEERGLFSLFDNLLNEKYEFYGIDIDSVEKAIIDKA